MDVARSVVEIMKIVSFYPEKVESTQYVSVIRMKNLNHRLTN
jgi:hypothetical protein